MTTPDAMPAPAKAGTALQALVACKCPKCRKGSMFTHTAYNLSHLGDMPERCSVCDLRFEIEPGFFWGAMYISYAMTVGISIILSLVLWWYAGNPSIWTYGAIIGGFLIVVSPLMLRYSRVLMLYLFGSITYDKNL